MKKVSIEEQLRNLKEKAKGMPYYDITTPDGFKEFCKAYGKSITPGLEEVDRILAESFAKSITKVIRSYA